MIHQKNAIEVVSISKQYRLGQIGTGTISHDLNRFWHKMRGKPDPYLKVGESNDRTKKSESNYVWSLRDLSFSVEKGDALGIIGRNGAGKSTLLKILSKVTKPTTGSIRVNGRIASLLEVGTGFNPEMTGRENIYLNGAILGMRKHEIDRKLDQIVDFSGVERYLDTPVKRYSSGMYVRLAFAVAAHLESEILIVDEVLAVGDAEFQKKCLGKMGEVSQGEGRTILFVSHNMGSLRQLCNKGILLEQGVLTCTGSIDEVVSKYLKEERSNREFIPEINTELPIQILRGEILNDKNSLLDINDSLKIVLDYEVRVPQSRYSIVMRISKEQTVVATDIVRIQGDYLLDTSIGRFSVELDYFPSRLLKAGSYSFDFFVGIMRTPPIQSLENALSIEIDILNEVSFDSIFAKERPGLIGIETKWKRTKLD